MSPGYFPTHVYVFYTLLKINWGVTPSSLLTSYLLLQVINYLLAHTNSDYYNNCDCKEPLLVEKNGSIHILLLF